MNNITFQQIDCRRSNRPSSRTPVYEILVDGLPTGCYTCDPEGFMQGLPPATDGSITSAPDKHGLTYDRLRNRLTEL